MIRIVVVIGLTLVFYCMIYVGLTLVMILIVVVIGLTHSLLSSYAVLYDFKA